MKNVKETREFLFQAEVKRASDGKIIKLKAYVPIELEWQGNKGTFVKTESKSVGFPEYYSELNIIDFDSHRSRHNLRFRIKNLEVERNLSKDFFKDKR